MNKSTHDSKSIRALENCSYCPRLCHFACPTAHGESSETASAWGMMGIANLLRKGQLTPTVELAANLSRCTSCMRCTSFCKHENPVADVLRTARADLASVGLVPDEVSVIDAIAELNGGSPRPIPQEHATRMALPQTAAKIGYLPGCAALDRPAERIDQALAVLSELAGAPVALISKPASACCGGWAERAGLVDRRASSLTAMQSAAEPFTTIISGCPSFEADQDVVSVSAFLANRVEELEKLSSSAPAQRVTLHGACLHRRPTNEESEELRVLNALGELEVLKEHAINGVSECCGGDAVYSALSPLGAAIAARSVVDGARSTPSTLVTANDRCALHMSTSSGETVSSILDLVLERCSTLN